MPEKLYTYLKLVSCFLILGVMRSISSLNISASTLRKFLWPLGSSLLNSCSSFSYCPYFSRHVSHYLTHISLQRICLRLLMRFVRFSASSNSITAMTLCLWNSIHLNHNCNCFTSMIYDADPLDILRSTECCPKTLKFKYKQNNHTRPIDDTCTTRSGWSDRYRVEV